MYFADYPDIIINFATDYKQDNNNIQPIKYEIYQNAWYRQRLYIR